MTEISKSDVIPRSLYIFAFLCGGMTCAAGILGAKQLAIGPLVVQSGIFPFLLVLLLSSSVAAPRGRDIANRLVRFGFTPLITVIVQILLFVKTGQRLDRA